MSYAISTLLTRNLNDDMCFSADRSALLDGTWISS